MMFTSVEGFLAGLVRFFPVFLTVAEALEKGAAPDAIMSAVKGVMTEVAREELADEFSKIADTDPPAADPYAGLPDAGDLRGA